MGNPPKSLLLRQPKNLDNEIILKRLNLYSIKFRIEMSGQTNHNYSLTWNRRVTPVIIIPGLRSEGSVVVPRSVKIYPCGFWQFDLRRDAVSLDLAEPFVSLPVDLQWSSASCTRFECTGRTGPSWSKHSLLFFLPCLIIPITIIIHTSLYTKTIRYIYHHAIIAESLPLKIWHEKCFTRNKTER